MQARAAAIAACLEALKTGGAITGRASRPTTRAAETSSAGARGGRTPAKPRAKGRIAPTATDDAVFAAVKVGCVTKAAIEAETKLPAYNVACALRRLVEAKRVTRSGSTSQTRYAGAGPKPKSDSLLGIA